MSRRPIARRLRPLRHALELVATRGAIALVCALPERAALGLGAALGRAAGAVLRRRARISLVNLRVALPEKSDAERRAIYRASMAEFGRNAVEWARLPRLAPAELRARVETVGLEHLRDALAKGHGALAVTAHYGNWELLPAAMHALAPDTRLVAVGRTLRNAELYRMIVARREQGGGELLPQDARPILRALREGKSVGVLVDQYTTQRRGGVLAPFLGVQAWTNAGPALLALRTGAPLVPAHAERTGPGRHRIVFGPEIAPARSGDRDADVRETTARINAALSGFIRQDPVPWLWSHRRFRKSPDAPADLYGRP
ncbi:MAG TPA: lysophospholipid acyltransferase family protein [Myxococcota bacterium]|jgi:KDO2-lipid IV(A) lauroyltransferase|nr:lysophospholipid acyltransferase family protein [Myxococcota bacterium]